MGKRSDFERRERDWYPTPYEAVIPLLPHLEPSTHFFEPCAGDGTLVKHLQKHRHILVCASDIEPQANGIGVRDVMDIDIPAYDNVFARFFITNPSWPALGQSGEPVISIINHLSSMAPTWLLLSADFAHNLYFNKVSARCQKIVAVGRVKWIPDSKYPGKDNVCWFLFDEKNTCQTEFYSR